MKKPKTKWQYVCQEFRIIFKSFVRLIFPLPYPEQKKPTD